MIDFSEQIIYVYISYPVFQIVTASENTSNINK